MASRIGAGPATAETVNEAHKVGGTGERRDPSKPTLKKPQAATGPRLAIADIKIGKRHRRDLGDIEGLAERIKSLGFLLHPIVVRPDGTLIAGERRLAACKHLGWTHVPVTVVPLENIVRGELAENVDRKDFLPSEIEAIRRELEPIERKAAKERMRGAKGVETFHTLSGKTRDKIGAFAGISGRTVEKIAFVVDAAEAEPEKYGKHLADMDRTGRVNGVFRQLKVAKQAALIRAEPPPLPGRGPYRVAVVDFPWPENTGRDDVSHRIVPDFPLMTIEEICAFPLASILMEDAVVWMWVTNYELLHGIQLRVLEAHGLKAKRLFTWGKTHFGGGDVLRGQTEHAIVAFRGKPPTGAIELFNQSTWLVAPAPKPKGHSRKPPEFYNLVESLCPAPRYADLFSRYKHNNKWDCHGDQAPTAEAVEKAAPLAPSPGPQRGADAADSLDIRTPTSEAAE